MLGPKDPAKAEEYRSKMAASKTGQSDPNRKRSGPPSLQTREKLRQAQWQLYIRTWSRFPDLRYEVGNGLTVCTEPCHKQLTQEQRRRKEA